MQYLHCLREYAQISLARAALNACFARHSEMSSNQVVPKRPFEHRVVIAVLIVAAIVALLAMVWQSAQVFFLVFGGVLLAVVLRSAGNALARWTGLGVRIAIAVVLLAVIAATGAAGWFAAPRVLEQSQQLQESVSESLDKLKTRAAEIPAGGEALERVTDAGEALVSSGEFPSRVAGGLSTLFGATAGVLVILAVGIFLAFNPLAYTGGFLRVIPPRRRDRASEVLEILGETLQGWIVGQLIAMSFLFLTTWLMLAVMGVPLSFLLGLITGVMAFVPYVGPILAALPILLVAFVESPALAVEVGLLFLVIQTLEDNVVLPLVFQRTVELPPALLITGQLVLGGIFGILGLIFATPLTALAMVFVQELYVEDTLDDSMKRDVGKLPELEGAPSHS